MVLHDPYIIWLPRTGKPIARCRACQWYATDDPFQAAAHHLSRRAKAPAAWFGYTERKPR